MAREGQERVEVSPGAFIWMDAEYKKRWQASQPSQQQAEEAGHPEPATVEAATVVSSETAAMPRARGRRAK